MLKLENKKGCVLRVKLGIRSAELTSASKAAWYDTARIDKPTLKSRTELLNTMIEERR